MHHASDTPPKPRNLDNEAVPVSLEVDGLTRRFTRDEVRAVEERAEALTRLGDAKAVVAFVDSEAGSPLLSPVVARAYMISKYRIGFSKHEAISFFGAAIRQFKTPLFYEFFAERVVPYGLTPRDLGLDRSMAFIHHPTTGGTSVKHYAVNRSSTAAFLQFGHRVVIDNDDAECGVDYPADVPNSRVVELPRKLLDPFVTFTLVRNIYDYIYTYARRREMELERYVDHVVGVGDKHITDRLMFFMPFAQPSGDLVIDWIARTEHMEDDLRDFGRIAPLQLDAGPPKNARKYGDYRKGYTPALVDRVSDIWKDDIRLYGFDFERIYAPDALLRGDVRSMRGSVNYSWKASTLSVTRPPEHDRQT